MAHHHQAGMFSSGERGCLMLQTLSSSWGHLISSERWKKKRKSVVPVLRPAVWGTTGLDNTADARNIWYPNNIESHSQNRHFEQKEKEAILLLLAALCCISEAKQRDGSGCISWHCWKHRGYRGAVKFVSKYLSAFKSLTVVLEALGGLRMTWSQSVRADGLKCSQCDAEQLELVKKWNIQNCRFCILIFSLSAWSNIPINLRLSGWSPAVWASRRLCNLWLCK